MTSNGEDKVFKRLIAIVGKEIKRCDRIKNFEKKVSCKAELMNYVTMVQDEANLNLRADFYNHDPNISRDKRWQPIHIVDDANAVILGIVRAKYDPEIFYHTGSYVKEKESSLMNRFWRLPKSE